MLLMQSALAFVVLAIVVQPALAETVGDPMAGEQVFRRCMACHAIGEAASNRVGPVLNGIWERPAGSYDGFRYSQAMLDAAAAGLVWDGESLDAFLENPRAFLPGNKMSFAGLPKESDRQNLLAYLATVP